ncbi:hypothetical protein BP00DRAFT_230351 [Aspergillus indologenus CBS 114.80]|uniref:Uncharacterized protein n=1 Tax=Aspergillus indologenus CBS 114.80 TaxID=1450541 RepID=A0A2V5I5R2_9EURO|nr:hypothetical protein BP00DRAFT_230351 [Aspergillus indologenus CBS 114.80]
MWSGLLDTQKWNALYGKTSLYPTVGKLKSRVYRIWKCILYCSIQRTISKSARVKSSLPTKNADGLNTPDRLLDSVEKEVVKHSQTLLKKTALDRAMERLPEDHENELAPRRNCRICGENGAAWRDSSEVSNGAPVTTVHCSQVRSPRITIGPRPSGTPFQIRECLLSSTSNPLELILIVQPLPFRHGNHTNKKPQIPKFPHVKLQGWNQKEQDGWTPSIYLTKLALLDSKLQPDKASPRGCVQALDNRECGDRVDAVFQTSPCPASSQNVDEAQCVRSNPSPASPPPGVASSWYSMW